MRLHRHLAAVAFLMVGAQGCIIVDDHPHRHQGHVEVLVPGVHVHDASCGHYYDGGRWYYWKGHHHGPGCGHVFIGGSWSVH